MTEEYKMKAIKSVAVMESFGMKDLDSSELMEIEGGWDCICKSLTILPCTCKTAGHIEPCKCKTSSYYEPFSPRYIVV